MQILASILFWAGIIALVDASIGLFFLEKWQQSFKSVNITRLVWSEIALAFALLAGHVVVRYLAVHVV